MLDAYERKARLAPAILACLPPLVLAMVALGKFSVGASLGALAAAGLVILLAGKVRELGKAIEPDLFESWGVTPTTQRLRWAEAESFDQMAERHQRISQVTAVALPDQAAESADPTAVDQTYDQAVAVLRDRTRGDTFPVVASENREYGFRRNCLGVKPIAIGIAAGSLILSPILWQGTDRPAYLTGAIVAVLALAAWHWGATATWVKVAADRYADRLISAGESLATPGA